MKTLDVLEILYKLIPNDINWVLTGSTSLILQGVDLPFKQDIDILVNAKDCNTIDRILEEYRIQSPTFSYTELYNSCYGIYNIMGVNVDLMGDMRHKTKYGWSEKPDLSNHKVIKVRDMELKVFSLEQELIEYEDCSRIDKVEKIKEVINKI